MSKPFLFFQWDRLVPSHLMTSHPGFGVKPRLVSFIGAFYYLSQLFSQVMSCFTYIIWNTVISHLKRWCISKLGDIFSNVWYLKPWHENPLLEESSEYWIVCYEFKSCFGWLAVICMSGILIWAFWFYKFEGKYRSHLSIRKYFSFLFMCGYWNSVSLYFQTGKVKNRIAEHRLFLPSGTYPGDNIQTMLPRATSLRRRFL